MPGSETELSEKYSCFVAGFTFCVGGGGIVSCLISITGSSYIIKW